MLLTSRFYWIVLFFLCCVSLVWSQPAQECKFVVVQTQFIDSVWGQGHAEAFVVSQDGGSSYLVHGGSIWWFGDTFKGTRDKDNKCYFTGAVSCSVAQWDKNNTTLPPVLKFVVDKNGQVAQAIEFIEGESWDHHRIWPLAGIFLNGKSYTYYSLIEITGTTMWSFRGAGAGLAYSTQPASIHQRIRHQDGWKFPISPCAIVPTKDWLYLFEVEKKGEQHGVWLARVAPEQIENPKAYQFFCGPQIGFSDDITKQVVFMKDIYGQVSVAWNEYLQKYVMVVSSDFFRPREIRFHIANQPYGLWSPEIASVQVPEYLQGKKVQLIYCSFLHPELFRENGKIMNITFSMHLENSIFDANNAMVEIEIQRTESK